MHKKPPRVLSRVIKPLKSMSSPADLLNCRVQRPKADTLLFCFPWAGGGSNFYAQWGERFAENVEVSGIRLPGRESRFKEPLYKHYTPLIQEVLKAIQPLCADKPFAFWGHSLGACLAFEVARKLKQQYNLQPVHLFVSGCSAPHSETRKKSPSTSKYSDEEFIDYMKKQGGTPKEVLEDEELIKLFLPSLRADLRILESYKFDLTPGTLPPLGCPLSVFDGTEDKPHDLEAWSEVTGGPFQITMLPGGHFYLQQEENQKTITDYITENLHLVY